MPSFISNRAAAQVLGSIQRVFDQSNSTVQTTGGSWLAKEYKEADGEVVEKGQTVKLRGVDMHLVFNPSEGVNASKIGLTQAITSKRGNVPHFVTPESDPAGLEKERKETTEGGAKIDRGRRTQEMTFSDQPLSKGSSQHTNPIYGADSPKQGQELKDTAINTEPLKVGKPNVLGKRVPNEEAVAAELYDEPRHTEPLGADSEQTFETTALALEGEQKNRYYGSVEWGWKTDADGNFGGVDFAVKSEGDPTGTFRAAAEKWNDSTAFKRSGFPRATQPNPDRPNLKLPLSPPPSRDEGDK